MMSRADYETRYKLSGEKPLAKRPISLRVPGEIEDILFALPTDERNKWLRRVILEAAQRELVN